jgi:integrase
MSVMMLRPMKSTEYAKGTTLGPHVEDFLASKFASGQFVESTVRNYRYILAGMVTMYPELEPDEIETEHLERVQLSVPPKSFGFATAALRSFWKWMRKRGRVTQNPAEALEPPKERTGIRDNIFTEPECAALEALPIRDGALMTLLLDSGIRLSEARALKWLHVDRLARRVTVVSGKGGDGRIIPVPERCVQRLDELAAMDALNPLDYLWYGLSTGTRTTDRDPKITRHKEIDSTRFYRWWYRCLDSAGVAYVKGEDGRGNPHTTRHTMATRWLRQGRSLSALSRMLGHKSIATTDTLYGHLQVDDLQAEVELLEQSMRSLELR